ncbi:mechanosensitive ion channel family protein [soil metagenome]
MEALRTDLTAWLTGVWQLEALGSFLKATILVVGGFVLARLARVGVVRTFAKTLSRQQLMLLRRAASYTILGLFFVSALRELGFDFGVLLGAAGIVTLAVGFASQTSVSNLISGLFVVLERAVEVGDVITIDGVTGEVLSIDLLSTKLRTFDNLFVRIPNETMVKTKITNLNRFPLRRVDLSIGVAYKEDLGEVVKLLKEVAFKNKLCLDEPEPVFIAQGFGDSSVDYQFSVWAKTENYLALRNSMQLDIKKAFDAAGIELPFPHRSLYAGSATEPFPVRVVAGETTQRVTETGENA